MLLSSVVLFCSLQPQEDNTPVPDIISTEGPVPDITPADSPVPDITPTDGPTDALASELGPGQKVNGTPPLPTADPLEPTPQEVSHRAAPDTYEDPPWNEATLVMHNHSHHMHARSAAWQVWAEAVRLQRMIGELEDSSVYTL